jgi:release factor glutamine methyltransferase
MGLDLEAGPGVLVPREETELLADAAIELLRACADEPDASPPRVIDMCCGAGNLACAIAVAMPGARVWASDLTLPTVEAARRNVATLGLTDRVTVAQGDLFSSLEPHGLEGSIDMIVCNPPYISSGRLERDRAYLLEHEPREAFDGGPYGLSIHQKVIRQAPRFLRSGGQLLFEVGAGQGKQVSLLFGRATNYRDIETRADATGEARVVLGVHD